MPRCALDPRFAGDSSPSGCLYALYRNEADRGLITMRTQFCSPLTIAASPVLLTLSLVFFPALDCSAQTRTQPSAQTTVAALHDSAPDPEVHDEGTTTPGARRSSACSGSGCIPCGGEAACRDAGGNRRTQSGTEELCSDGAGISPRDCDEGDESSPVGRTCTTACSDGPGCG